MAAEVLGSGFKFVIQSLLGGDLMFPELRDRVARMADDAWYAWDDYVRATRQVAALLDERTVADIGQRIMTVARPLLQQQGFSEPRALLSDWRRVFTANVRGLDEASNPVTREVAEGRAVIEYGTDLPPALVEGYLRGAVLMFDRRVERFAREIVKVEGVERLRCTIEWR